MFFHGESHVGIYIGGGQFVHAPHTGDVVKVSSLSGSWYAGRYDAVRIGKLTPGRYRQVFPPRSHDCLGVEAL